MPESKQSIAEKINRLFRFDKEGFIEAIDGLIGTKSVENSTIPRWMKEDKNNLPNSDDESIEQPTAPITNQTNNTVYVQPRTIYEQVNIFNTTIVNELPTKPDSLLPIKDASEQLNQSPTKVTIGNPISLATSLKQQKFGKMIFSPFSEEKTIYRQAQRNRAGKILEALNEAGIEELAGYLAGEGGYTAFNAICLLMPPALRGLSGGLSILFGYDTIRYYFANNTAASINAFVGVSDRVPNEYEIEYYDPDYEQLPPDLHGFDLLGSGGGSTLDLGELEGEELNFEQWIKGAVNLQYGEGRDEKNSILVDNFPNFLRHLIAPLYYRSGLGELPFIVPKSLLFGAEGDNEENQAKLQQMSALYQWQIEALDGLIGQFPIKIRIEDTDLIKTGDQELDISLPNIAETLAELVTLSLANQTNNNALLKLGTVDLIETGQAKQQAIINYYLIAAIQEYLGFESKQSTVDVDFQFNPTIVEEEADNQTLDKFLSQKTLKVPIEINNDEDTLEKQLFTLKEAARIIKAVNFRPLDARGDLGQQIAGIIKQAKNLSDALGEKDQEGIEDLLKSIEEGFSNKIPYKDSTRPYNRPFSQRPLIKYNKKDGDDNNT